MKIWFTEIGEPLPIEGDVRLHRYGLLTRWLAARGHEVTWWTSTFSHAPKRHFRSHDSDERVGGVRLRLLSGPGYRRNISLARFRHQAHFARRFYEAACRETVLPDLIISPVPTLETAELAVRFGRERGIPVLTDIRDEWPEEFVDLAPKPLRPLARLALRNSFAQIRAICTGATGVLAMSRRQLDYGLKYAARPAGPQDGVFPLGYSAEPVAPEKLALAREYWRAKGVGTQGGNGGKDAPFVACFFGTIGQFFDLETVISAARELSDEFPAQFVLCGEGSRLENYRRLAHDLPNVIFPGWMDGPRIAALMELSQVGLAPYVTGSRMSLPNKPFEYFAGSLPVASSISGELEAVLRENDCGRTYHSDSVPELVAILRELHADPARARARGARARAALEKHYATETIFAQLENHLEKIARAPGASA